jgi:hypothetical protein
MRKLLLFLVVVVVHQPYVAFVFAVYIPRADGRNLLAGIIGRNGCCDETTLSHNRDANQQFVVEDRPANSVQPFFRSEPLYVMYTRRSSFCARSFHVYNATNRLIRSRRTQKSSYVNRFVK